MTTAGMEAGLENRNVVFEEFMTTAYGSLDPLCAPGNLARKPEYVPPPPVPGFKLIEKTRMRPLYNRTAATSRLEV